MFAEHWVSDFIIYSYALSLLFAFANLMHKNPLSKRMAQGLLVLVWFMQASFFAVRVFTSPVLTPFDSLFFYSWALVTFTLVINALYKMDLLVFLTNVIGFAVASSSLFFVSDDTGLSGPLLTELVFVHVSMALVSYAAFSLSAVSAGLYLLVSYLLKRKKWNLLRGLPSLDQLQSFSNRLVVIGVPFLLTALILGSLWAYQTLGALFWVDAKIFGSLLVLLVYSFHLYQRYSNRWPARQLAWWNLAVFMTIWINYFISNTGLSFHQWL
ncbi:inner membrane protein YpjD [Mechercharimyces sp. CAU 1602]|uniref:cytochrome C assembly family protein n=1 Tax=Mechercharimyces sp. CAU 1602 TaxID=2973933 RepID=UPI0021632022|nr:cytochrome c biogenesis protein [Mechercharimyces sp. CAU 1602]MCS1351461.1 cytochrome c biogenesis protein [Mechercharimyces sp. CAU 1602]